MQYYSLEHLTTRHIHNWASFLLWLSLLIPSGAISLLFSNSIGQLLTWGVHLSVSYLFAFSYCSWGSQVMNAKVFCHSLLQWTMFYENSPPWPVHLGWPYMPWLIVSLSYTNLWPMWLFWLVFFDFGFHSVYPLMNEDKRHVQTSWWEGLAAGILGLALVVKAILSKLLLQFSADGLGCDPSL